MTFEETCENILKQQDEMKEKLNNISLGIEMLKRDNEDLIKKNIALERQIEELKQDKERLQDLVFILTKPKE